MNARGPRPYRSAWRRKIIQLLVVALTAALLQVSGATGSAAALPAGGMSATEVNAMFRTYGDAGGHWTGGDGTASVLLPDGRLVWIFSDSFLGTVNPDGSRPATTPMVNNLMVVQDGTRLTDTLNGGTTQAPKALFTPAQNGEYAWVADAVVEDGAMKVLYNRYRRTGTDSLDFALTGTSLVTFTLPGLTVRTVQDLPLGTEIGWGSALLPDGDHTYVYGTSSAPGRMKFAHLARAAAGDLGGAWEFWTGSGWSADPTAAGRLLSGVGTNFGVQKVGSQYVLVTHENNLVFDPQVVAYTAGAPTGPFTGPTHLLTAPEQSPGEPVIIYAARLHPDLARPGKLLVSYDVNSLEFGDTLADARLYRPRFVEIDWPRPAPAPGVPAAPAGLTVTAQNDTGQATWQAVPGATSYRLQQRDVTAGQTHFVRHHAASTATTQQVGGLITGHRYEFRVTAANAAGEGAAGTAVTVTPVSTKPAAEAIRFAAAPRPVTGSYLVRVRENSTPTPVALDRFARQLVSEYGGQLVHTYPRTLNGFAATLTEQQAKNLAGHPDVLDVEQDQIFSIAGEQADPPDHLDRVDQRNLPLDRRYIYPNAGDGARVYVVDSGIRSTHTEFGGRVTAGRNVRDGNNDTDDCNYHGTHMAGVIGGAASGVAKGVQLVPVKVSDCYGEARGRDIAAGIEWATADADERGGASVMNISLGWEATWTEAGAIDHATRKAVASGVTVVAAAGNDGGNACDVSPAHVKEAITVGATLPSDARHPQSNQGTCVDLYAPGVGIPAAGISRIKNTGNGCRSNPQGDWSDTEFCVDSGTSQAAAMASGAAAIVLTAHPGYGPAEVEQALKTAATPGKVTNTDTPDPRLLYIDRPPTAAPTGLTATAKPDGTIGLSWTAVPEPGVHYLVYQRDVTAGEADFQQWTGPVFTGTTATAKDLFEGHQYEFVVAAANTAGTGPRSAPASAVSHVAPPPAPTGLTATAQADGTIKLNWASLGADIWYYVYQRDITAGETAETRLELPVAEGTSMTAGYLRNGHEYEFRITGINRGGEGPKSAPARATSTYPRPAPPTGLTAKAGDGEVELKWTASTASDPWYQVYQRDVTAGETAFTALPLPITSCCTMTAGYLTNGHTYEFKLRTTAQGVESVDSNVVRATPQVALPGQVTGLTATAQTDGSIRLAWTSPGENLWFDVYQRDVTAGAGGFTKLELPVTECCVFDAALLTHQHIYEFKVAATNAAGAGPQSAVARATARYSPPAAPRNLRGIAAGDGSIDLDWDPPAAGGFFYWIYRRDVTAGEAGFTKLPYPTEKSTASLGLLAHNHVYEFKVTAANQGGEGPASSVVRVTAKGGLPAAPSGLTASAGNAQVTLRWTASATSGVLYNVYQRDVTANQSWQRLELPVSGTTMSPGFLTNGHTYEFRVTASNSAGDSAASNVASARPMPPLPQAPTGLTASTGDGRVTLRWNASSTPNVAYWIEQRPAGGTWQRLPYPVMTCCTFNGGLLTNGTTYEWRVRANNMTGDSGPSNTVSGRPMPPFPSAPSGLSASPGDGQVTLRWTASPTANVYYWVELRAQGGSWQRLQYPLGSCCSYTVKLLLNGTTYDFRLRANNLSGDSSPSNTATARPMPPIPQAPSNARVSGRTNSAIVYWNPTPTPRVFYRVYMRNVSRGTGWSTVGRYIDTNSHTVPYLAGGDLYEFRVTAENLAGESSPSNTTSVRLIYYWGDVSCTDYYLPVGGFPVGWTSVNMRANGVGAQAGVRVHVTRQLYWNNRWWITQENWQTTNSSGRWSVPDREAEGNEGTYDMYLIVEGPNGEDWGYMHDRCVGTRG